MTKRIRRELWVLVLSFSAVSVVSAIGCSGDEFTTCAATKTCARPDAGGNSGQAGTGGASLDEPRSTAGASASSEGGASAFGGAAGAMDSGAAGTLPIGGSTSDGAGGASGDGSGAAGGSEAESGAGGAAVGGAGGVSGAGGGASPHCGDGIVNGTDKCDDKNDADNDGCKRDCTWTCEADRDCGVGDICVGTFTCDKTNPLRPVCRSSGGLNCKPSDACHSAACDAVKGCVQSLIDGDSDGHAATSLGACGDDCDDGDGASHTGAQEICGDGKDNNCTGGVDETMTTWYKDCDGDSYAVSAAATTQQCNKPANSSVGCPSGTVGAWTSRIPVDDTTTDCNDKYADVKPAQKSFFPAAITGATSNVYDYNCSKTNDQQYAQSGVSTSESCAQLAAAAPAASIVRCFGRSGWIGTSTPACGDRGDLSLCLWTGSACARSKVVNAQQVCR